MTTTINFDLSKLLKEKDWNKPTLNFYFEDGEFKENVLKETTGMDYGSTFIIEFSELIKNWNDNWLTKKNGDRCFGCNKSKEYFETFSAPTIAEVIMWIYDKYKIWISIEMIFTGYETGFCYSIRQSKDDKVTIRSQVYSSIENASFAAIIKVLKEIV